jgi:hypothetical protein
MSLLQNSNAISSGGYNLTDSVRFRSSASSYLSRTPTTASNRKTWTMSMWVKRGNNAYQQLAYASESPTYADPVCLIGFSSDTIDLFQYTSSFDFRLTTTQVFRDPSAWYHIVWSVDTTQATSTNRVKLYVNGEQVTSFTTATYPSLNFNTAFNYTGPHLIAARGAGGSVQEYFDGYMTEVNFVDGQALTPSDFGETDTDTGVWKPKKYTGTYGTNGFYLPMKPTTQAEGFNTVIYTGNGTTQSITGVGFSPDLVWVKSRSGVFSHNLADTVRGGNKRLFSNLTNAEDTDINSIQSFTSDGFQIGSNSSVNGTSASLVAWCWDAGSGSPVSNTDGTITSTVKANTAKGFSVVSWVADNSASTRIGHGLGTTPKIAIIKNRDTVSNWQFYTTAIDGSYDFLYLNTTDAKTDSGLSTFTSTTIAAGGTSTNTDKMIAYCFAEVAGYSKFGSYTGNGTSQSINLGFRPAFVMWKRIDAAGNSWIIKDNTRYADNKGNLFPNATTAENTDTSVTFTDTGFDVDSGLGYNGSGRVFIYMAFADTRDFQWNFDASGNKNNWTPNNINSNASGETTYDIMSDVPTLTDEDTANFCTMSPIDSQSQITLSEGNLKVRANATAAGYKVRGTQQLAGKIYFEGTVGAVGGNIGSWFGIADNSNSVTSFNSSRRNGFYYNAVNMRKMVDGAVTVIGSGAATAGDIIGLAYDLDGNTFSIYKNNVALLTNQAFTNDTGFVPIVDIYRNDATDTGFTLNFGQRPFAYTPPTGYKKLNTYNLPDSSIKDGSKYMNTVVYTGNNTTNNITGVGFSPDFVWIKNRGATAFHSLVDSVRGFTSGDANVLYTNSTNAEGTSGAFDSFDSDGFSLSTNGYGFNQSPYSYVAWNWRGSDSAPVSNTNGTITSTVSANTTAGFSVVSYVSNGTNTGTVGHGLSQKPDIVIQKNRTNASDWLVQTQLIDGSNDYLLLNTTAAAASAANGANATTFGSWDRPSGNNMIAYCFAPVEGFSKMGTYSGNGSTDGTFVYTGFRPAYLMVKRTDSTGSWFIQDTTRNPNNVSGDFLLADSAAAEGAGSGTWDNLSNGFKLRTTSTAVNASGGTYIYMAFAENPFKNSLAR